MEFLFLPLLLLVGLLTTLDGGDDDTGGGEERGGNDTLAGSGTDRIFGGDGDDDLTLIDDAAGLGGAGDDTLRASGNSTGYGLDGNDNLLGIDNATVMGGAGHDVLAATDWAVGYGLDGDDTLDADENATINGGEGNDRLSAERDAAAYGGDGNDTLTASEDGRIQGGAGDDLLVYTTGRLLSAPEDGADIYVLDHAAGGGSLGLGYQTWDAADRFAIHLGTNDLSNFKFSVTAGSEDGANGPEGEITELAITETAADGTTTSSVLSLRGVYGLNLRDIVLYGDEIGDVIDWKEYFGENDFIEATGTETVYGGVGNDHIDTRETAVSYGGAGDDLLHTWGNSTAYGGAGDDRLSEMSITDVTLHGDAGNDILSLRDGTAFGGEGNDHLNVSRSSEGYGDAGNDVLITWNNAVTYGGAGDDRFVTTSHSLPGTNTTATGGAGADLHLVSSATYGDLDPASTTTITDFDPTEDDIGVVVFPEQQADITVNSSYDAATDTTVVTVVQAFDTAPLSQTLAAFRLQGQQSFDAANLRFVEPPGY